MTRIVIGRELQQKLLQEPMVELVDEDGQPIGSFVPFSESSYDPNLVPPISPEERAQLMAEPGLYSTAELLEHLRSL